jgi:hypothetical protein
MVNGAVGMKGGYSAIFGVVVTNDDQIGFGNVEIHQNNQK